MVTDCPDSFLLGLSISDIPVKALLDSGATHCFIDSALVSNHRLPITPLPQPMHLRLFDGSYASENIVYEVTIPVSFAPGKILPVSFLVTPLDPEISAVIRLHWLHQYNLLVDWANNRINFRTSFIPTPDSSLDSVSDLAHSMATPTPASLALSPSATLAPLPASSALPSSDASAPPPQGRPVSVCFVNAVAFRMLSRINNVHTGILQLNPMDSEASICGARPIPDTLSKEELNNLCSQVPPKYHKYLDIFSKTKSDKLPDHNPQYDHHIHLEEGTQPPLGLIYNMSETEAVALREFLKENLDCSFIHQSQSPCVMDLVIPIISDRDYMNGSRKEMERGP